LDLQMVKAVIDIAVGKTRPDLTLLLTVSPEIGEMRRAMRQSNLPFMRDRIEEADKKFFERVAKGYEAIAAAEKNRVCVLDGSGQMEVVCEKIWEIVLPVLPKVGRW
jgi:dTMP kinase